MSRISTRSALAGCLIAALAVPFFSQGKPIAGGKKDAGALPAPTIACFASTEAGISIQVTAGSQGALGGFSLQWMTAEAYAANRGWYASDNPLLCKASYSGNAGSPHSEDFNPWSLAPGASVVVLLGDNFDTIGYSSNCMNDLLCGTDYVIRAFAHATGNYKKSAFTANLNCSTLACEGCTLTQGYWKNHGPEGCMSGMNPNEWPVTFMLLGEVTYTDLELCAIFQTPSGGGGPGANGLLTLAHQLIAAKLNEANGAPVPPEIAQAIMDADFLIGGLVVPPSGSGYLLPSVASPLVGVLTDYNGGALHCEE